MYNKALEARNTHLSTVKTWEEFMVALSKKEICLATFCDEAACEIRTKDRSKEESLKAMEEANEGEAVLTGSAKTLCIPFEMGYELSSALCPTSTPPSRCHVASPQSASTRCGAQPLQHRSPLPSSDALPTEHAQLSCMKHAGCPVQVLPPPRHM